MTVLAKKTTIGAVAWTDLTADMDLAAGVTEQALASWQLEAQLEDGSSIEWRLTVTDDGTAPAADAPASIVYARSAGSDASRPVIVQDASQHWWARAEHEMTIVALPTKG